ncbi:multifunctional acyl-CoA thioesterase I/protease I/lysophospholipase L1 [Enterovibrio sp. ZSDZ35]|uniref:Multifunctional acyl-CoA thioesterase I/protease I/lysophospholipase L1 n=1 Tax=Enterovibrio qingdaonensis TaxID=2899818 RepID=A0ABT5QKE9_9GAMM|nr:multifunctional acyl-CoA thioesterase I/protease I/lysophospholipase L1 [Enterovibrio sp. ZSDZ35]MDD1781462.1 multifunctional acyl-CoA thioesterase I/protease I/lysophospholipase L1 [Enterovibrio sp. ZSDZ35]
MFRILTFCLLLISHSSAGQTLMVLGDSLSAGYQMAIEKSWPSLMAPQLAAHTPVSQVVNASISGDTTGNSLDRLPQLLEQHKPDWVMIELGANDGLRGFPPNKIRANLEELITISAESGANVMLMQIHIPPNYGQRYSNAFANIYPTLSKEMQIPLLPFFMEKVVMTDDWMMSDGLHPKAIAQPWIADFMTEQMSPYLNQ